MPLEKSKEVDAIGINKESNIVELTITDNMDWSDEGNHLLMLQEKFNSYLAFIESGEIYESYPKAEGHKICITLYSKYKIPHNALNFLSKVVDAINEAGFSLKCLEWVNDNSDNSGEWKSVE